ncbi:phytoene/squalene synthase family protein [Oceanomicrobium pacificus]|uniref:Squalene/phytoene synthase family protein n=1 Tax=Oceanomicrobium pacificus TaxID=2692916 RepID=A0A6B0TWR0_9RHOB|nr:squalene/phytoene synthase family protein [Oceanomicrobium pacificus]MXU65938.1 squalene/phytoene synthase family protein [Oceanomicrobium pacificus]
MSLDACAAAVERGDPDRFRTALLAPMPARGDLLALYAFNLEVVRAPWVTSEPMLAEIRLQWWVDALDEIFAGKPPRAHEVVAPLADAIARHDLPQREFSALIAARRFDIGSDPQSSRAAFDAYIDGTAGALMRLAARICDCPDDGLPVVTDLAYAGGVAALWQAVPALLASGRDPVPTGWVTDHAALARGEVSEPMADAIRDITSDAAAALQRAREARARLPRSVAPALLTAVQAGPVLAQAATDPAAVVQGDLGRRELARRWSALWRGMTGRW